ncbi:MAG: GGDEF domain-containing protein [Helicobacteraceae bacterium]|nr:GGDEF domain-containing protein [Candidatus Sulfurimonas ponti]
MNDLQNKTLSFLHKLSYIGVKVSDSEHVIAKKTALTLIPFYVSLPAVSLSALYFYFDDFQASLIPSAYIIISLFSALYLYKTKNFVLFECLQLTMILFSPFVLMWMLGGFNASSFVFIWAFYAPVAAAMYSENIKLKITWFLAFIILLLISTLIDSSLIANTQNNFPKSILDIFFFLNISTGLGGIYFLISHFINNIQKISQELHRDRESLYILTNDLKSANKELEYLANCDIVTDLPNRLSFMQITKSTLKRAQVTNKKVAIMFLDLDGFKAINDTLGHEAGDMILKVVGARLTSVIRASDTVARIGGDEFAISLGDIANTVHVEQIAKTIIKEVNELCHYNNQECHVGVSIGISLYPDHGEEIEDLMKKADEAMYNIKKTGKNNYAIFS